MKLTESKLKRLINEVLNENRGNAEKIFSMLQDSMGGEYGLHGQKDESQFNQAVSLAIGANLVNDVLSIINEKLSHPSLEYWQYDWNQGTGPGSGPGMVYSQGNALVEMKKKFMEQVVADMGSTAMQSYKSQQKT